MKTVSVVLPDKLANQLKNVAATLNVSADELIARSLEEFVLNLKHKNDFQDVGFGMWKDRADMTDSTRWVRKLREREWRR